MEIRKFGSIEQFRNVVKKVKDHCEYHNTKLPTLAFTGTVKLHGTNAGIGYDVNSEELIFQSKERILTLEQDNAGFMLWGSNPKTTEVILEVVQYLVGKYRAKDSVYIYGEWAGGNIQKKVGICNAPKRFYIFSIVVDGVKYPLTEDLPSSGHDDIYWITEFPTYKVTIDFNRPELVQNQLVELTIAVEDECPVTKQLFGTTPEYSEMNKVGEGIVWYNHEYDLIYKTKGELHSSSKVKTVKSISAIDIEMMNSINEFVTYACSENRMNQALDTLKADGLDIEDSKNISPFIKWTMADIMKEEQDTIVGNGLDPKKIGPIVAKTCREFYLGRV